MFKKWCGLRWPIARKNDLISLRSGALVAILYIISSMLTNVIIIWKPLDKFFLKLDNLENSH